MSKKKIATNALLFLTFVFNVINTILASSVLDKWLHGIVSFALAIYFALEIPEVIRNAKR